MIDINLLRENEEEVRKGVTSKNLEIPIKEILRIDESYRKLSRELQELYAQRNKASKNRDIEKGRELKTKIDNLEAEVKEKKEDLDLKLSVIPNLPLKGVPIGNKDDFEIIKTEDKPRKFDFASKDHLELGEALDIIDIQRASKVSGTRFGYLKNEGALLEFALINFALENLLKENFIPIVPPALIKKEITGKLGYWEMGNHNNYYLVSDYEEVEKDKEKENPLYLIGTAEHAIVPMHSNETFNVKDLPKKYAAFSPSFRREAGSYGKDTRGIFRVHQFDKIEMVGFVKPEDDEKERRKMLSFVEGLLQKLELPYRVVKLASGDLAFPTAETIDIEIWMPSQNKYRETHSISTTTDFQSRRLNIKCQDGNEKKFVHILNGTAFAIGRTIIAILENYQQEDGSVLIPKVLQKYTGFSKISPKSS